MPTEVVKFGKGIYRAQSVPTAIPDALRQAKAMANYAAESAGPRTKSSTYKPIKVNPNVKKSFDLRQYKIPEITMEAHGASSWLDMTRRVEAFNNNTTIATAEGSYKLPLGFVLSQWAEDLGYHYSQTNNDLIMRLNGGIVQVVAHRHLSVSVSGDPTFINEWAAYFNSNFEEMNSMIEWVYDVQGRTVQLPLSYRPAINAAYPNINGTVKEYIDEYLASEASVLILIGKPGTGKTSFIKEMIYHSNSSAKIAFDPSVIAEDSFFANFMQDSSKFLIMEDADTFLASRSDGNKMMHKFLNLSDGLISTADKKLVFSTNLPNINDIDDALLRPGRCFDVLQFRTLSRAEAQAVYDEVGNTSTLPDGSEFTLAELFTKQPSGKVVRKSIGFA